MRKWRKPRKPEAASSAEEFRIVPPVPFYRDLFRVGLILCLLLAFCYVFLKFIGEPVTVSGQSMNVNLENGDILFVEKVSYRLRAPQRFEIVVFDREMDGETYQCVKRIIGLPGETVQIAKGRIYINGRLLEENYCAEPIKKGYEAEEPVTLGEDEYFVLGDNRNNSVDSRFAEFGTVKTEQLLGRAVCRFFPLDRLSLLGSGS